MTVAGPFRPVCAFGKSATDTADAAVDAGAATITVNGHAYNVGNHIWISKSDDTAIQYLGPVLTKDTNSITTTYGANASKGTNAKLWTATTAVVFARGESASWSRSRHTGTKAVVSRGGKVYSENAADGIDLLTGKFSPGLISDYNAWRNFIVTSRTDGALSFTLAYWDWQSASSKSSEVRWSGGDLVFEISGGRSPLTLCNFEIAVFVVTEDTFVAA